MNTLALDLGTKTGWCLRIGTQPLHSGFHDFKPGRFEGGGMRYLKFSHWLNEMLKLADGRIDYLCFEEVRRHLGVDAAHAYGGFLAHLTAWCEQNKVPYEGATVQAIKIAVTGKGNSNKEAVITAVVRMGYDPKDDNEADAIALMTWALKNGKAGELSDAALPRHRVRLKSLQQPAKKKGRKA